MKRTPLVRKTRLQSLTAIRRTEMKRKGKKHPPTQVDRDRMAWVASLPCAVCGARPVHVHHLRHSPLTLQPLGARVRIHAWTIPLCPFHHKDGPMGEAIHAGDGSFTAAHGSG